MGLPIPYKQRVDELLDDDFFDDMYVQIASGGSVLEVAKQYEMPYGAIMNAIKKDPERTRRYHAALNDRADWFDEALITTLKMIAFSDPVDLYDDDGSLKPISEWPESVRTAVKQIDVSEIFGGSGKDKELIGEAKKVGLIDRLKALELLMKYRGLLTEKHNVSIAVTLEQLVLSSYDDEIEVEPK